MANKRFGYTFLAFLSLAYIMVVYYYQNQASYIWVATAGFALFYVIWGIIHHLRARNFHPRIVLEYLLVAALGVIIVSTLLI